MKLTVWPNGRFSIEADCTCQVLELLGAYRQQETERRRESMQRLSESIGDWLARECPNIYPVAMPDAPEDSPEMKEWRKAFDEWNAEREAKKAASFTGATLGVTVSETPVPVQETAPEFRYFLNAGGTKWKMPTNGGKGFVSGPAIDGWIESRCRLGAFLNEDASLAGCIETDEHGNPLPNPAVTA